MRTLRFTLIGMTPLLVLAGPVAAQLALTGEIAVNTLTTGNQLEPAVALQSDGEFVVTWESEGADGDESGVRFRRFTSAGAGVGDEFEVNDVTAFSQRLPAIGTDGNGNFRVAWQTEVQQNDFGVAARTFAADGTPDADEFQVNQATGGFQHNADIVVADDGSFVVVWQDDGQQAAGDIFLRTFDDAGDPISGEVKVNQSLGFFRAKPAVARDGTGELVVVWEAEVAKELHNIYARLFDADGDPLDDEFRVNATVAGSQKAPDVARLGTGEFMVVWESTGQDGDGIGIYGQRFSKLGVASGPEFRVNLGTAASQFDPSLGLTADGTALISFRHASRGVLGRAFAADGATYGGDFQISDPSPLERGSPSTAVAANGDFVVAWESEGQDGSGFGIRMRMYSGNFLFRDDFESGNTDAWTTTAGT